MVDVTTLDDDGDDEEGDGVSPRSIGATSWGWDPDMPIPEVPPMTRRQRIRRWIRYPRYGERFYRIRATIAYWPEFHEDYW